MLQIQIYNSYRVNGLKWEEAFSVENMMSTDFIWIWTRIYN